MSNRWHLIIQETLLDPETKFLVQFASNEGSVNKPNMPDTKKRNEQVGLRCNWSYTNDSFVFCKPESSERRYTRESILEMYTQELIKYKPPVEFILSYSLHKITQIHTK